MSSFARWTIVRPLLVAASLALACSVVGCDSEDGAAVDAGSDTGRTSLYCPAGLGYIAESSRCVPCGSVPPDPTASCSHGFDRRRSDCPGDDGGVFYDCRACDAEAGSCDGGAFDGGSTDAGAMDAGALDASLDAPADALAPMDAAVD